MPTLPALWVAIPLKADIIAELAKRFDVVHTPNPAPAMAAQAAQKPIVAVLTNGSLGLSAESMALLPQLKIISCFGVGFENVDRAAARVRAIAVTNAPGVNDVNVADHAMALTLGIARDLIACDRAVREGRWDSARIYRPALNGKRMGLIGLGNIGMRIARRAAAFDMQIGYHARNPRPEVDWKHYANLTELARDSDYLIAACPGGPGTHHIVNAGVLAALGKNGFFINIARGSVVDTQALIAALEGGVIAGAGLDVVEGEPVVPEALLKSNKVLFTPHLAGRTPEVVDAQLAMFIANAEAVLAGKPPRNPVPV
jgi:lactate dehydrogenase-like 2-hydroxyacid dehydrogenase